MKKAAQLALAIVVLMAAMVVVSWPGRRAFTPDASAQINQPTPLISDILRSPTPKGEDDDEGGKGGGGGGGGGDDDDDDPLFGGDDDEGDKDGDGKKDAGEGDGRGKGKGDDKFGRKGSGRHKGRRGKDKVPPPPDYVQIPGSYNTEKLVSAATQLRALGMSQAEVIRKVFPPFIIAGPASWIDSWHFPRYGPAPGQIRQHEGQDVFCKYGDPILAPEPGTVSFSDGGLGGITARVHLADGSYWYLTHLSGLNTEELAPGDSVQVGDVLGYCGNSGNAATTSPHVHFGWYLSNGKAKNPMKSLVNWLRIAERRLFKRTGIVNKTINKRAKNAPLHRMAHLMGDRFAPDLADFRVAGESLWASGSDPGIGIYASAEAALKAALATHGLEYELGAEVSPLTVDNGDIGSFLDPESALARLLEARHVSSNEAGD